MPPETGDAVTPHFSIAKSTAPIAKRPTVMPDVPTFRSHVRPFRSTSDAATRVVIMLTSLMARSPTFPSEPVKPALWKITTA